MKVNLLIPTEPKELKTWMKSLKETTFINNTNPNIDWDSFVIWSGNQLPKYLWKEWKDQLKPQGFTWQKILKLLRYRTDRILLWFKGGLLWEDLIKEIINLIEGPTGQDIRKR